MIVIVAIIIIFLLIYIINAYTVMTKRRDKIKNKALKDGLKIKWYCKECGKEHIFDVWIWTMAKGTVIAPCTNTNCKVKHRITKEGVVSIYKKKERRKAINFARMHY